MPHNRTTGTWASAAGVMPHPPPPQDL